MTIDTLSGMEVGCRYRWPYDGCHPDCWQPPLKGAVLEQTDPRAWKGSLAFPCRDGDLPDADKVKTHVQWCHGEDLLNDKVPVLYQGVDASGPFIQWESIDALLPYGDHAGRMGEGEGRKAKCHRATAAGADQRTSSRDQEDQGRDEGARHQAYFLLQPR